MYDVIVIGAGPAGLAIAGALASQGLVVAGLAPADPASPWPATYGIWVDELEELGLSGMLQLRWQDCSAYTSDGEIHLAREYGLIDNARLQAELLLQGARGGVVWHKAQVAGVRHLDLFTEVHTTNGVTFCTRLVVDASGHRPVLVRRPRSENVSYQAAYGIVGTFSQAPVRAGQMVLMDYRVSHLRKEEIAEPATFLYAMDLGEGRFFVEETSLACAPAVPFDVLEKRLYRRLEWLGAQPTSIEQVEQVLFPMDLPLPFLDQAVLGFGGAASMVHPASGYSVGASLRWAKPLATAIRTSLVRGSMTPGQISAAGWQQLWPASRVRRRALYVFGLNSLLRMEAGVLQQFFAAFFRLPQGMWSGYLSDTLDTRQLLWMMLRLFSQASNGVQASLARSFVMEAGRQARRIAS